MQECTNTLYHYYQNKYITTPSNNQPDYINPFNILNAQYNPEPFTKRNTGQQ
jgi:hypothetical protein